MTRPPNSRRRRARTRVVVSVWRRLPTATSQPASTRSSSDEQVGRVVGQVGVGEGDRPPPGRQHARPARRRPCPGSRGGPRPGRPPPPGPGRRCRRRSRRRPPRPRASSAPRAATSTVPHPDDGLPHHVGLVVRGQDHAQPSVTRRRRTGHRLGLVGPHRAQEDPTVADHPDQRGHGERDQLQAEQGQQGRVAHGHDEDLQHGQVGQPGHEGHLPEAAGIAGPTDERVGTPVGAAMQQERDRGRDQQGDGVGHGHGPARDGADDQQPTDVDPRGQHDGRPRAEPAHQSAAPTGTSSGSSSTTSSSGSSSSSSPSRPSAASGGSGP